jgi:hypothetical protein
MLVVPTWFSFFPGVPCSGEPCGDAIVELALADGPWIKGD